MKRTYSLFVILVLVMLSLTRCDKGEGPVDTTLTIYPTVQQVSGGDTIQIEGWQGYYLIGDTSVYAVNLFEKFGDSHFITKDSVPVPFSGEAEIHGSQWVRFRNMAYQSIVLLIVHPQDSVFAWRQMYFVDGLDSMSQRLFFKSFQSGVKETQNKWNISYVAETTKEPEVEEHPAYKIHTYIYKLVEGSDDQYEVVTSKAWQAYYFAVEDRSYTVASLDDAKNRVLTPATDLESFNAENDATTEYVRYISLPDSPQLTLLVMYEPDYGVYAYRYYETAVGQEEENANLYFRLDRTEPYTEAGWTVVPVSETE